MSAARFCKYLPSTVRHRPDKSGLPSAAFGAGADKIGLPSGVRGVFGSVTVTHCANAAVLMAQTATAKRKRDSAQPKKLTRIARMFPLYFPTKRWESFSFSHTDSINSLSGNNSNGMVTFQALVYALGSSIVISYSRCPKSRRWKRSVVW